MLLYRPILVISCDRGSTTHATDAIAGFHGGQCFMNDGWGWIIATKAGHRKRWPVLSSGRLVYSGNMGNYPHISPSFSGWWRIHLKILMDWIGGNAGVKNQGCAAEILNLAMGRWGCYLSTKSANENRIISVLPPKKKRGGTKKHEDLHGLTLSLAAIMLVWWSCPIFP